MKTIFSKNRLIALLILINFAFGFALFGKELPFPNWKTFLSFKGERAKPGHAAPPAGMLDEATLKDDSAVQFCYDSFLKRAPQVSEGTVVMQWMFTDEGRTQFLNLVRSDLDDEPFLNCLTDTIRNTRWPASDPRAGKLINHKFKFHIKTPSAMQFK